jgi:hypothetical protein
VRSSQPSEKMPAPYRQRSSCGPPRRQSAAPVRGPATSPTMKSPAPTSWTDRLAALERQAVAPGSFLDRPPMAMALYAARIES